ncbi:SUKH-4 family immunity protein [Streptomyces griseoviridis]
MVTFAQAQERAEEWINGDMPSYQHRAVRVREFDLGFVLWAEDRADGPRSDGGGQRLVVARDSGEATLWPALPVGEVIRRYEEEYGRPDPEDEPPAPTPAAARVDLNQTSFLLSPPEWLQEAADKLGIPDRRGENATAGGGSSDNAPAGGGGSGNAASGNGSSGNSSSGNGTSGHGGSGNGAVGSGSSASGASGAGAAGVTAPAADSGAGSGSGAVSGSGSGSWGASGGALPRTQGAGGATAWPEAGGSVRDEAPGVPPGATPWAGTDTNADNGEDRSVPLPATVFAAPPGDVALPDSQTALIAGGSRLPPTAVAPALDDPGPTAGAPGAGGTGNTPAPGAGAVPPPYGYPQDGTPPPPAGRPYGYPQGQAAPGTPPPPQGAAVPGPPPYGYPQGPGAAPGRPLAPHAADIADAATSKAAPPPNRARGGANPPPPPGAPGTPGARPGSPPPPPAADGYVPTQFVASLGPDGAPAAPGTPPQAPAPPNAPGQTPPGGVHHAATVLAGPQVAGPGAPPPPPGPPGAPGAQPGTGAPHTPGAPRPPGAPVPPGAPGAPGAPSGPGAPQPPRAPGSVHQAETVLSGPPVGGPGAPPPPPGMPGAPGGAPGMPPGVPQPPAYGYPPQQQGQPTVGPGYQAVLRFRAQDGSEQQVIRRSAPGTPHPEWQIFHELRGMNVPPDQVLELHTELESCELPGAYCARMIREQWPQARITSIAPYGADHASRQQGMSQLLAHQGELHQVADGPARPAPVRAPLPPVPPAPPIPPEGIAQELAGAFGPGVFRFEQAAVSRQGVPPVVAHTLVVAGLPLDMGPFFWAQAQPGRPVPTLAELAQERGVRPASDAGSYLVMGSDFGKAVCVQYGTANIVAVPVEAGPGGAPVAPQFVNTGLPEFQRCLALLGRMWRLRFGLNQEQAGRWTVDFQAQLASLDPAALGSPESWWSVLLEQMWDGLL